MATGAFRPLADLPVLDSSVESRHPTGSSFAKRFWFSAERVLELLPAFRYSRQFSGVDCAPTPTASLGEALRAAGLPE
jgi:hypothetical protein